MNFFTGLFKEKGILNSILTVAVILVLMYLGIFVFKFLIIAAIAGVAIYYLHKGYKYLKNKFTQHKFDTNDFSREEMKIEESNIIENFFEDNTKVIDVEYEEIKKK
ncbi:hypothetical protein SAMN02745196_00599 [Clostridium collagenovorans DSM 3089]|uniref:Uncharacterized protein n=1 Tax=Clostridium collagenovorans DSM 3089 TaxID=1121306 RepID=A0A1M5TIW1_9CLOT|nr:hypothetical protein [Clostridium collagenovorans]SHH50590.1 hypothetical protein SAMN02745196_00599 [Clostridium collagenovorans DSM 3089]